MSAIGGKADLLADLSACPLIARSGHSVCHRYTSADSQIALFQHRIRPHGGLQDGGVPVLADEHVGGASTMRRHRLRTAACRGNGTSDPMGSIIPLGSTSVVAVQMKSRHASLSEPPAESFDWDGTLARISQREGAGSSQPCGRVSKARQPAAIRLPETPHRASR